MGFKVFGGGGVYTVEGLAEGEGAAPLMPCRHPVHSMLSCSRSASAGAAHFSHAHVSPSATHTPCRFQFCYSAYELPHIQNDRITLNNASAGDHQVRGEGG